MPRVDNCTKCPALVESRNCIVNPYGNLDEPDILFVGDAPGWYGNRDGSPFMGADGKILVTMLQMAEIPKGRVALDVAVRCHIDERKPTQEERNNCWNYLIENVKQIKPKVIVALGQIALQSLYSTGVNLNDVIGQVLIEPTTGTPVIPTYHPNYLFRKTGKKPNWHIAPLMVAHIQKAYRIATGELTPAEHVGSYYTVKTIEELKGVVEYLKTCKLITFDTETTGLRWQDAELITLQVSGEPGTGFVIPFLHSVGEMKHIVRRVSIARQTAMLVHEEIPQNETEIQWLEENYEQAMRGEKPSGTVLCKAGYEGHLEPYWPLEDYPTVIDLVRELLSSDMPKAAQNAIFDLRMLERDGNTEPVAKAVTSFGFKVNNLEYDTMIAAKLINENVPSSLTTLTSLYTDIPYYEEELHKLSSNYRKMQNVPDEVLWEYGATDVDVLQELYPQFVDKMGKQVGTPWLFDEIMLPLIRLVCKLQERGVLIDREYFQTICDHYEGQENTAQKLADEIIGDKVSLGWQYLQGLLFDELKMPLPPFRTTSGKGCKKCSKTVACRPHASTGKEALAWLYDKTNHPVLPHIQTLKKVTKFRSTYLSGSDGNGGYARHIDTDGRIHASWGLRTETGRLNCTDPNLMNIPNKVSIDDDEDDIHETDALKRCIVAPEGYQIMDADWNQMELWVLAYRAKSKTLLDLLRSGKDVHTFVAKTLAEMGVNERLFPKEGLELDDADWAREYPLIRRRSKVFVFGMSYGLTEEGAAARLECDTDDASRLISGFLEILPELPTYMAEIEESIRESPHAVRNWAGRWRHFPQVPILLRLGERYKYDLESLFREGINMPIQSGAHDLHAAAWIRTERDTNIMARCLPVIETHDSLTMEALDKGHEYLVKSAWMVKNLWEETAKTILTYEGKPLGWEIPVAVSWGPSLGSPEWELTPKGELKEIKHETVA